MKRVCKKTREHLISFITYQLKEQDARDVAAHLAACPPCSREAQDLQSTWELMGEHPIDGPFNDIAGVVLGKVRSADDTETVLGRFINRVLRIPVPALCTFMAVLALPAGIYLGKNLHFNLSAASAAYRAEEAASEPEELPLEIFSDFPENSLGSIYDNLANAS